MTDKQMVEGCISGKPECQRQLYEKFQSKMLGVCHRYVNTKDEAQDILQEGFIKIFNKISSYEGKGSLEGWVRKVMVNTALQHLRKYKTINQHLSIDDLEQQISSNEYIIDSMNTEDILSFIQKLPVGYRTVFNLFAIEGYSHKEIAEKLDISVNTSFSQFSRAKSLLQKLLKANKVA